MGSDMFMNPPQKKWHKEVNGLPQKEALAWASIAMDHDFEVRLQPDAQGWSVLVFKGQWT